MLNRASQVLNCRLDIPVIAVEPGFPVETRTAYGVHGEKDDLAFSVEWRDAAGCSWTADFSEEALAMAELRKATILICDLDGAGVIFRLYKPDDQVDLPSN